MRTLIPTRLPKYGLLILLLFAFGRCQKKINEPASASVDAARYFFESSVAPNGATPKTFGPAAGQGQPVWSEAKINSLPSGDAVWVPVHYQRPFFIGTNFSAEWLYDINQLQFLVVYFPYNTSSPPTAPITKLMTYYPDSNAAPSASFSGIIREERWDGLLVASYRVDKDGSVYKSISRPLNATSQRFGPANQMIIRVCYTATGYNYDANDPDNGYYWEQDLGCSETFVPDTGGGGGDELSGTTLPPGYNSSFGMFGAHQSFAVRAGNNIIGDIRDYNRCFDNIAGNKSYSVTVCVDQPKPGTREPWGLAGTGSSATGNPVSVGHTFLILSETGFNGTITRNVGFYPKKAVNPIQPLSQGQLNNDADHEYNISLNIALTNSEFFQLLAFIEHGNDPNFIYDLNSNNCTNFAINALAAGGILLPATKGTWPNGEGYNPGDLGEDIRGMQLGPNMARNTTFNDHPNLGNCY